MDEQVQSVKKTLPQPHPKKLKILTTAAIYLGNIGLVNLLFFIKLEIHSMERCVVQSTLESRRRFWLAELGG